jgi:hypothetical protein
MSATSGTAMTLDSYLLIVIALLVFYAVVQLEKIRKSVQVLARPMVEKELRQVALESLGHTQALLAKAGPDGKVPITEVDVLRQQLEPLVAREEDLKKLL